MKLPSLILSRLIEKSGLFIFICMLALFVFSVPSGALSAEETDCLVCHEQLSKEKVVHAALQMGCPTCHSAINAKDVPHKKTNKIARGLSSDQPDLCYGCHDKSKFALKNVHAAVGMGCTSCHNPHSSKNPKLLVSNQPDLCYGCHDKGAFAGKKSMHSPVRSGACTKCHSPHSSNFPKLMLAELPDLCYTCHEKQAFEGRLIHAPVGVGLCLSCHFPHQSDNEKLLVGAAPDLCYNCHEKSGFNKKNVHVPVASGLCLNCHKPHVAEEFALLNKDPLNLCFECHPNVRKTPHAMVGFSTQGHPVGFMKRGKRAVDDPARPGKRFYCGSCHNPHTSDSPRLFRYEANMALALCINCHKM